MKKKAFICAAILPLILHLKTTAQAINPEKIDQLIKKAEATHTDALIIYKNDTLLIEKYWNGTRRDNRIEMMSCTKSVVGLAVVSLLDDGLIRDLDVNVSDFYPEWRQGQKQYITLRHLVNMTSGLQNNPNASVEIYPSPDFVQLALAAEIATKPGEYFSYNNKALNLVAGIFMKITGKRMDKYIEERLFTPLGISDFTWSLDSAGNPHVMSGCQIRPIDFAKLGNLILKKGMYKNKRVLSEKAVTTLLSPCEKYKGYAVLWWLDYEQNASVVDDEIIAAMKNRNLDSDFIRTAEMLKGTYFQEREYVNKIESIFGSNPWGMINQHLATANLSLRRREFIGKIISYRADGYLGNYLIIVPHSNIVAVRMITQQSFREASDNFTQFKEMLLTL